MNDDSSSNSNESAFWTNPRKLVILANLMGVGPFAFLITLIAVPLEFSYIDDHFTTGFFHFIMIAPLIGLTVNILPLAAKNRFHRFQGARPSIYFFLALWGLAAVLAGVVAFSPVYEFESNFVLTTILCAGIIGIARFNDQPRKILEPQVLRHILVPSWTTAIVVAFNLVVMGPIVAILTVVVVASFMGPSTDAGAAAILISIPVSVFILTVINGFLLVSNLLPKYRRGIMYSALLWIGILLVLFLEFLEHG